MSCSRPSPFSSSTRPSGGVRRRGREKDVATPFLACNCTLRMSVRRSLAMFRNGAMVAFTCCLARASRISAVNGTAAPGVAACSAETSSLIVKPPSRCGSMSCTRASTSMPSATPSSSSTLRMPSAESTSPCFAAGTEANTSAIRECAMRHRSLRSSRRVAGAKIRIPRANSTGSREPSLSVSMRRNNAVVSDSVKCTLAKRSWNMAGVFRDAASSTVSPCTKAVNKEAPASASASIAEVDFAVVERLFLDLECCRGGPPDCTMSSPSGSATRIDPLGDEGKPNSSLSKASPMLRKRCLTFLRMSSLKRLGSTTFSALTNWRRLM
mmetsp:Transcript_76918/g.222331  ORF Transcript_76918/g.222331 Transcript_76918/m.222331 type:complete len:325 (+) Transcript_76918:384-1358(+)